MQKNDSVPGYNIAINASVYFLKNIISERERGNNFSKVGRIKKKLIHTMSFIKHDHLSEKSKVDAA